MRLRVGRQMSYESAGETRLVSGAKLAPQGRLRKAQGASPGNKHSNKGSPEGAMQLVPEPKRRLMTSIYLELRSNSLRRPFRAFRNLALEPRACALGCPAGPLRGPWFRARNYIASRWKTLRAWVCWTGIPHKTNADATGRGLTTARTGCSVSPPALRWSNAMQRTRA